MDQDYTRVGDHVAVLRRHWWIVALCCLLGAGAGAVLAPLGATTYTATAIVLAPEGVDPADEVDVGTQSALVTSDRVVQSVIADLGLSLTPRDLEDALAVEVVPDTTTLSIAVTLAERSLVANVANAVAETYLATQEELLRRQQTATRDELEQQLAGINEELLAAREDAAGQTGAELIGAQQKIGRIQQRQRAVNSDLSDVEAAAEAAGQTPQSQIPLQRAVTPKSQAVAPARGVLLGLPVGFIVGLALAYWRFRRDDAVRGDAQLTRLIGGAPVLGRIPTDPRAKKQPLLGRAGADPMVTEGYRSLAGNVRLWADRTVTTGASAVEATGARGTRRATVVAVTSPDPGAGKTTVACNLALGAAATGLTVLLVDADLHRPRVAALFGVAADAHGLSDVLRHQADAATTVVEVNDTLGVLPAGTTVDDPFSTLVSSRTSEVWEALRGEADLVIVDTAPLLYASESVGTAARCDQVLLVVEPGRTKAADVAASLERLQIAGTGVAGAVLNRVRARDLAGGYYGTDGASRRS